MTRIQCKAGDKVVLYRKDKGYPDMDVGLCLKVLTDSVGPYVRVRYGLNGDLGYRLIMATSLRYLRKTDKGAKVVIVRNPKGEPLAHAFLDGEVVTSLGEKTEYRGEYAYRAVDTEGLKQWILPSQFKLAKEQ